MVCFILPRVSLFLFSVNTSPNDKGNYKKSDSFTAITGIEADLVQLLSIQIIFLLGW